MKVTVLLVGHTKDEKPQILNGDVKYRKNNCSSAFKGEES